MCASSWHPENRGILEKHLSATRRGDVVAVDWDGTCVHNDVGAARFYHAIIRGFIDFRRPEVIAQVPFTRIAQYIHSLAMRDTAAARLEILGTIVGVYFALYRKHGPQTAFPWPPRLYVGKTSCELEEFSRSVLAEEASIPFGCCEAPSAPRSLWEETGFSPAPAYLLAAGVRPYAPVIDLLNAFADRGAGVFVVSASEETAVRVSVETSGLKAAGIIGQRLVVDGGLIRPEVLRPLTVMDGKLAALALVSRSDALPSVAAGDTSNDVPLLNAASRLRILIDHGKAWFADVLSKLNGGAETVIQEQFASAPNVYMGESPADYA
ncbi:MAG TPA: hypothetical protein ENN09_03985 [Planctomycetes bacterium]|nr:hypothetical protein [Planctomycetota bacterium]